MSDEEGARNTIVGLNRVKKSLKIMASPSA